MLTQSAGRLPIAVGDGSGSLVSLCAVGISSQAFCMANLLSHGQSIQSPGRPYDNIVLLARMLSSAQPFSANTV